MACNSNAGSFPDSLPNVPHAAGTTTSTIYDYLTKLRSRRHRSSVLTDYLTDHQIMQMKNLFNAADSVDFNFDNILYVNFTQRQKFQDTKNEKGGTRFTSADEASMLK